MPKDDSNWGALAGIGFEVLAGVGVGLGIGFWLDKKFGWAPRGAIVGSIVGMIAGMYLLIRDGMRLNRNPKDPGSQGKK